MTCDDVAGLLLPALRGALTDREGHALGAHVTECVTCAHDLPELEKLWALLDEWVDEEPNSEVGERLAALARKTREED